METVATVDQKPDYLDGVQFKRRETDLSQTIRGPLAAIRVDGRAFSQLTRKQGYALPYDLDFMAAMDAVAQDLLKLVDGSYFAYAQSDEVSVIFGPTGGETDPHWWFGGKVQKLTSLAAARASLSFLQAELKRTGEAAMEPLFDARVLELDDPESAWEYLRWRRYDAQKNSVTMAAQTLRSHGELHGVSSYERRVLLKGTKLEQLPEGFFNGRLHYRTRLFENIYNTDGQLRYVKSPLIPTSAPATKELIEDAIPTIFQYRSYGSVVVDYRDSVVDIPRRPWPAS